MLWNEAVIAATKPNILMIVMDDLRWNDTSYKGSDIPTLVPTPTIDKPSNELRRSPAAVLRSTNLPHLGHNPGLASAVILDGEDYGMLLNQTTLANELAMLHTLLGKWHFGMYKWPNIQGI